MKKQFSLGEQFAGRVKRLTLTIQDAPIYKSPEDKETLVGQSATIFGTLQMFKEGDKTKVENINFTLPLNFNADLKNHLVSMIAEAVLLKHKVKKDAKSK